jgi:hypothetical protein
LAGAIRSRRRRDVCLWPKREVRGAICRDAQVGFGCEMTVLELSFAPQDVAPRLAAVHQQSDVRTVKVGDDPLGQRIFDIIKNSPEGTVSTVRLSNF